MDYEPNNCHQSSIWGSLKMRCLFFHLKFISDSSLLFSIHSEVQPMKTGSVTSVSFRHVQKKKVGQYQTWWAIVFSRVLFSPSTWPTNPSVWFNSPQIGDHGHETDAVFIYISLSLSVCVYCSMPNSEPFWTQNGHLKGKTAVGRTWQRLSPWATLTRNKGI